MLEYDNSAFYYFALTLLVIYIIPGTYFALSEFFAAFLGSGEVGSKARTKLEAEKASKLKTATTGFTRLNTTSYVTNLVCVLIAWFFFLYLMALVINDGEVNTFDPYVILGIAQGSATGEIKKAYRRLSLKYHPDKNIGDKIAEEMFMRIAKAYEALTDETSKENYEKFGNPDGKQALEVSIGLPSLISMVVVIPSAVGIWYANSKQFGEKNIMYETYNAFYTLLAETHRVKNMPEIIAASAECRAINTPKPTDNEPMGLLYGKMKSEKLMVKPKFEHATVLRGNLLMHAHLMRLTDSLNPVLLKDLNTMLGRTPELIEGLVEISHQRKWLEVSIAAIKFAQCVVQGLWTTNDSLEQLPYFGEAQVKAIAKSAKPQAKSLGEYLLVPDEEKTGLSELTEDQKEEVLKEGEEEEEKEKVAPQPEVSGDEVYEQDLVTLRVTFTRENVSEGKRAAPVYAPYFPKTVRENWWVVLTDKGANGEVGIHAFEKVGDQSRTFSHELRFMAPQRAGDYEMTLQLLSDCYQGLDQTIAVPFTVRPASELPEFQPHPEDLALDNEPTLFEQVMAANVDEESSDEEDDEEEEEIVKAPAPAPAKGSVVVEDVDDSEEED
ncbi:DnaJ-like/ Sec63 translocase subunit [Ochromonadaceae sp. CCMP2298]|nr:DnaJ-like/ Sec63 translocase subunit [Ochromonadaceae sp. CCMP2298]